MEENPILLEKPQNGLAGLKHWRQDMVAGLVVSLISLPFSLGIALASGAPPICGLISAIIAGLVLPFLGGSFVTVSGPAAGLAPVLLASMLMLGRGNREVGYPLLLVAICLTGLAQVVLARFKAARFAAIFPASVVEGMLAAIGLLIIAKQLPLLIGHPFHEHDFWPMIAETPHELLSLDPKVFFVGTFCLALIFALASLKSRWLKVLPPQVIAAVVGLILGQLLGLSGSHLIQLPEHPFKHGIVPPNFRGAFGDHTLWWALATTVITLTLIDGVESLATIAAIDKIDPFRRKSDPNRTLFAMGVSNMCSSMAGGLTIIPGGVKSTACIVGGGRTQWANFYNACFLIIYILLGRGVINLMPLSALGAIVIYTGYKLCAPKVWKHVAHIGTEQLVVFTVTVLVTISTDLLWGIAVGILTKLLLETALVSRVMRPGPEDRGAAALAPFRWLGRAGDLFRSPVLQAQAVGGEYHMVFGRSLVCFNSMHVDSALAKIPASSSSVSLHISDLVTLVDHTAASALLNFVKEFQLNGRGTARIVGLERLRSRSHDAAGLRVSPPVLSGEWSKAMTELSRLGLGGVGSPASDPAQFLERISLTRVAHVTEDADHEVAGAVALAFRDAARKAVKACSFLRTVAMGDGVVEAAPDRDLVWASLTRVEKPAGSPDGELATFSLSRVESGAIVNELDRFGLYHQPVPQGPLPAATGADETSESDEDYEPDYEFD